MPLQPLNCETSPPLDALSCAANATAATALTTHVPLSIASTRRSPRLPRLTAPVALPQCVLLLTLALSLNPWHSVADAVPYLPVGAARAKKPLLSFPRVQAAEGQPQRALALPLAESLDQTLRNDLVFIDLFKLTEERPAMTAASALSLPALSSQDVSDDPLLPPTTTQRTTSSGGGVKSPQTPEIDFAIQTSLSMVTSVPPPPTPTVSVDLTVTDEMAHSVALKRTYVAKLGDVKNLAHTLGNDILTALTGTPGIFHTKISMSCSKNGKKEIYWMNFDGSHVEQISHHHSLALAPAWSPNGQHLAYSLYTQHANQSKNLDLYEFNLANNTLRVLSHQRGINSGAAYSPDGKTLALTLSYQGNPEVYLMNLATHALTPVTHSFGVSVDPAWSPDGQELYYVSSQSGSPMIYKVRLREKTPPERLTYAGSYNATPNVSPKGDKVIFAGWLDKFFDLFMMNPDGTHIERLTADAGSNEDPGFSPDGNLIVFSSNRSGNRNIYVMNRDGSFVRRLTYGMGDCASPKWSPPLPAGELP